MANLTTGPIAVHTAIEDSDRRAQSGIGQIRIDSGTGLLTGKALLTFDEANEPLHPHPLGSVDELGFSDSQSGSIAKLGSAGRYSNEVRPALTKEVGIRHQAGPDATLHEAQLSHS